MKKIKKSHVLVIGSGPSVKKYWNKIDKFIKENNVVTFGCNNIMYFLVPDYHFWGSTKRWNEFGNKINKKTTLVVSKYYPKNIIKKTWKGKCIFFNHIQRLWRIGSDIKNSKENKRCQVCYRKGKMFGCVRDIATWAIFYAYTRGASKISVVGNDGYTLYSESCLKQGSQHCYGKGLTAGFGYMYCRRNDWFKYKTLRLLQKYGIKKYGFGFEILTPTVFDEFYNSKILDIGVDPLQQKWVEPLPKEYNKLYNKKNKFK